MVGILPEIIISGIFITFSRSLSCQASLATSLNDNDKFLIIVADSSSETGYTNKIVNSSTLKATYGGSGNNNPAIVLPLDASDPTKIDYSKLSAMTGATTDSLLLIKADGTIGKMTISAVRGSGASAGTGSGTPSTGGTSNANQLDFSEVGGILASTDTDMALILREDGSLKKVSVNDLKGEGTLTTDYMTLNEEVGTTYRITVGNDGNLKAVKNSAYTTTPPTATQNTNFHGLLINSMYGAGTATTGMPISHNFIELYNNTINKKKFFKIHYIYVFHRSNYCRMHISNHWDISSHSNKMGVLSWHTFLVVIPSPWHCMYRDSTFY